MNASFVFSDITSFGFRDVFHQLGRVGRGNASQELIAKIFVEKEDGPGCFRERKLVEVIERALLTRLLKQPLEFSAGSGVSEISVKASPRPQP